MQAGATFADVLDARLGGSDVPPRPVIWSNRPVTAPLFVFELPLAAATAGGRIRSAVFSTALPVQSSVPRSAGESPIREQQRAAVTSEPPARPATVIRLTAVEARAMAALNALGAGLDETISPDTLRRAFRRLARRYHPDRHPGSGGAETARLARLFADATAHYRLLAARLDARLASR
jgi:hypothetical protein